jgi:hypothetical protein
MTTLLQICSNLLLSSHYRYRSTAFRVITKETENVLPPTTEAPEAKKAKPKLEVLISFNGMNHSFKYTDKKEVATIREHALDHYKIKGPDRELNFLFGPDNQSELPDGAKMGDVVAPNSQLYLRPRAAGGGS